MKRLTYTLILLGITNCCNSQTFSHAVTDSIIESFMIWEVDNIQKYSGDQKIWKKKIKRKIINWEEAMIGLIGSANFPNSFENQYAQMTLKNSAYFKRCFNEEDINYLKLQYETPNNLEWHVDFKKGKLRSKPRNNFYSYTTPLFNKSHTVAIQYKEYYCGALCGYGHLNVYVIENGIWKLSKSFSCWVS